MAKFPGPESAPQPGSLRPVGPAPVDRSYMEIVRGAQDLAAGIGQMGDAAYGMAMQIRKEQNTADLAAAEAHYLKRTLEIGNEFDQRNDWDNFGEATGMLDAARDEAAQLIRDPKMRESWVGDTNLKNLTLADSINDRAVAGRRADNVTRLETSLDSNAKIIADPTAPEDVRRKALMDSQGALIRGLDTALITRDQGEALKQKYLDAAEEDLAVNTGMLEILRDPARVMKETGVPAAISGTTLAPAAVSAGTDLVSGNLQLASVVAAEIGDHAFPKSADKQAVYLSDPEIAQRYTEKAIDLLSNKYDGDVAAALIALHPDGGDKLARTWMKGLRDDHLLPVNVRKFMYETMKAAQGPAEMVHLSAEAEPGVEIADIDAAALARFEKAQSAFGQQLLIVGGNRETLARGQSGFDVDISKLNDADKARFVETASAMGFLGIDVTDKVVHLDMEDRRFTSDGAAWAEDAGKRHKAGKIIEIPLSFGKVDDKYAKLSFDKRLRLYSEAKAALDKRSIEMRAGIEIAEQNAPIAIMNGGKYDDYIPTAQDYVKAYGAQDGLQKYEAFKNALDVADTAYDMRTMSAEEIADTIDDAVPTSTGIGAIYEQKRYDALTEAGKAIMDARKKDPAAYVNQMMPEVGQLYEEFGKSPEATKAALTAMDAAQTKLGIVDKRLLPKAVVDKAVALFNTTEASPEQRTSMLLATVFATNDEDQQRSILKQFKDGGIPEYADLVFDAYARGDEAAARYLMRGLLADPKAEFKSEIKESEIDLAISGVFSKGGIGEAYYGLDGTFSNANFERAVSDSALMKIVIKQRLQDGSAKNLQEAVTLASKDMWGGIKAVQGSGSSSRAGMLVTIPEQDNEAEYAAGFTALLPDVASALKAATDPLLSSLPPGDQALSAFQRDIKLRADLRDGHFVNAGNGTYQYLTLEGRPVADPQTGEPLVWTADQVKAAAAKAGFDENRRGFWAPDPLTPSLTGWWRTK